MIAETYRKYVAVLESLGFAPTNPMYSQPNNWTRKVAGSVDHVFLFDDGGFRAYCQGVCMGAGRPWELLGLFSETEDEDAALRALPVIHGGDVLIVDSKRNHLPTEYCPTLSSVSTRAILASAIEMHSFVDRVQIARRILTQEA